MFAANVLGRNCVVGVHVANNGGVHVANNCVGVDLRGGWGWEVVVQVGYGGAMWEVGGGKVFVFGHTHTHIYIYIYMYIDIRIYIYMYMYICVCVYIYMYICGAGSRAIEG